MTMRPMLNYGTSVGDIYAFVMAYEPSSAFKSNGTNLIEVLLADGMVACAVVVLLGTNEI